MASFPDPLWPVVVVGLIQLADGFLCLKPVPFVAECLRGVRFPQRFWWVLPPVKFAAGAGLILGIWVPYVSALTIVALIAFFMVAITAHIRARDFGHYLFINATGMLVLCVATAIYCF